MKSTPSRELLCSLAKAYGVDTEYWAFGGSLTQVADETLIKVLAAMGADAATTSSAEQAIKDSVLKPWREVLPECTIVRVHGQYTIPVHLPHGSSVSVQVTEESGQVRWLAQIEDFTPPREVDGVVLGQASFAVPEDLPLGYHTLGATITLATSCGWGEEGAQVLVEAPLIAVPQMLPTPSSRGARSWGAMVQLYSVRSRESWGVGDTADLKEICSAFGAMGGDFVLINPLHAAEPEGHMTPSPYLPVTRRFFNPLYIRPEDIREVGYMPTETRSNVRWAGERAKEDSLHNRIIDRDRAWEGKRKALEIIFQQPRSQARERDFQHYRRTEGQGLEDFAFWCALREKYGEDFPAKLSRPDTPAATVVRQELSDRIDFYTWMQWIIDQQLEDAQRSALDSGMSIGIFHDLAVGVHATGSDTWSIPEAFAQGVTVGAPPDMYNQQGQNWSQPPWRPDSLRKMAYAPLRDMAKTVLRHAGALRVDHVMGLFRLWWIPEGADPSQGAYVRFDQEAMVGVLMLEAARAGAIVVGEDLGNVEPWVRDYLSSRGILGTSVMWFEQESDGQFRRPTDYRRETLVTVDTHDLPPVAGYLAGEHVVLREHLGLLTEPVEQVRAEALAEKQHMLARLHEYGLVGENPREQEIVEAMHRYIARTPAELLAVALVDGVGERRAQNQPGTDNEYPNWRVPLADGSNHPVMVEDLSTNERLLSLVQAFTGELRER